MICRIDVISVPLSHLVPRVNFFYTPPDAWRGKIYDMAWEKFFPQDAVQKSYTIQKDMYLKKYYKIKLHL